MGKVKNLLVAGGITIGALGLTYVGERAQPVRAIKEAIQFHNVGPAPSTPDNYKAWHIVVEKDKNLDAIVKFTDDSTTYFLHKELGPVTAEKKQEYETIKHKLPAEETPQDFLHPDIKYELNDKGRVELYFGNKESKQYWRVNENWTAGSIGEQVDKFFEQFIDESTKADKVKENIKKGLKKGWEKTDSLYQDKKEAFFSSDTTKQNFWEKTKETAQEAYHNVVDAIKKK